MGVTVIQMHVFVKLSKNLKKLNLKLKGANPTVLFF